MFHLRRVVPAFLLFLFSLWAVPPLWAQRGNLEGEVRDREGQPLVEATIVIERTDRSGHYETKTDKKGRFQYAMLPAGSVPRYTVKVIHKSQVLYELPNVIIAIDDVSGDFPPEMRVEAGLTTLTINLGEAAARAKQQATPEQRAAQDEAERQRAKFEQMKGHFERGTALLEQKDYAGAVTELEAARDADPTQVAVWIRLAQAYGGAQKWEEAVKAYQEATAMRPDDPGLFNNLGEALIKVKRLEEAAEAFEKAAQIDPANAATFYFNQGVTFYNAGKLAAATEPLRKATELNPTHADSHYWLGVCLYSTAESKIEGNEVKTILKPGTREAFEKYLELAPTGRYANEAKALLEALDIQVPAAVRTKKKK